MSEFYHAVDKVAQVLQQVVIVDIKKLIPLEFGVARLRPPGKEEKPPDVRIDSGELCRVAEDTDVSRLAEFATLVIQILCR